MSARQASSATVPASVSTTSIESMYHLVTRDLSSPSAAVRSARAFWTSTQIRSPSSLLKERSQTRNSAISSLMMSLALSLLERIITRSSALRRIESSLSLTHSRMTFRWRLSACGSSDSVVCMRLRLTYFMLLSLSTMMRVMMAVSVVMMMMMMMMSVMVAAEGSVGN